VDNEKDLLKICKYGEDILKHSAREITEIDQRIVDLVRRMAKTLYAAPGVGLAAPQVGESIRLFTVDISSGEDPGEFMALINPKILEAEGGEVEEEGCLSLPGEQMGVRRATRILLSAITLDGKPIRQEFSGYKARVLQHEYDHLDGILIIDRVSPLKRALIRQDIQKKRKSGEW